MPPTSMRAAYITELGPPENIRVGSLPVPALDPGEVLVRVELVALNPVDTLIRAGRYRTRVPFPFVVGRDLVGRVEAAGAAAGFAPGERVWCNSLGHDGRQGSFAELAVVPADRLYRLPDGVDAATAVAVAHPAATAYLAWFVHGGLRPGHTVYVGGAGGNVGTAAVTLAAAAGARVIGGARPEDHARCREAGAVATVDYRDPELAAHLRDLAPGGIDVHWETSGHHDFDVVAAAVAIGGRVLLTASAGPHREPPLPVPALYTRDVSLVGFVISRARASDLGDAAGLINDLLRAGRLSARIADVLPLSATGEAHRRMEAGEVDGRVLLDPARA